MILSENSIEHALLMLGAMRAGVAVVPVSPAYSFGHDLGRLGTPGISRSRLWCTPGIR